MVNLPKPNAGLRELVEFCRENDPSEEFIEKWGAEYKSRILELWADSTHAFKEGCPTGYSKNELLLCMAYDVSVAPCMGVPEDISHAYLKAMLGELRAIR